MRSILWLFICVPSLALAEKSLPAPMPLFLESVKKLQPYMVSEQAFADPANEKAIQEELNNLNSAAKNLMHEDRITEPLLKKAAANVQAHLNDLSEAFKISKTYSRFLLNATLSGCSSCHAQISPAKHPFLKIDAKDLQGSAFQKAEFLYAIRQFEQALKEYQKVLKADALKQKQDAYLRGLSIYLVHLKDLKGAETWTKNFPVKHDDEGPLMKRYLTEIQTLSAEKTPDIETANHAAMEAFAEKSVKSYQSDNLVRKLYTSGILHAYVLREADANKSASSAIYYWLGKSDASLKANFIFSLVDDYFRRCIDLSPKSVQAKACAEELEKNVLVSYEGSGGIHIPSDQGKMLNEYRKKAGLPTKKYPN